MGGSVAKITMARDFPEHRFGTDVKKDFRSFQKAGIPGPTAAFRDAAKVFRSAPSVR
jgi:hypothetical protein